MSNMPPRLKMDTFTPVFPKGLMGTLEVETSEAASEVSTPPA
jgi:hypothetical protein